MRPFQGQERSVQNDECGGRKAGEDSPLKSQSSPEDVSVAERPEPEHIHVIGQRGPATEEDGGKYGENEKEAPAAPRRGRCGPVNGLRHLLSLTPLVIRMILPSRPQVWRSRAMYAPVGCRPARRSIACAIVCLPPARVAVPENISVDTAPGRFIIILIR